MSVCLIFVIIKLTIFLIAIRKMGQSQPKKPGTVKSKYVEMSNDIHQYDNEYKLSELNNAFINKLVQTDAYNLWH